VRLKAKQLSAFITFGFVALKFFAGVGHDSCLRQRPDEWKQTTADFLDRVLGDMH
jgi:hypothetical protein